MNVTDIALSVGYRESSCFSRLFKERFDISPRDYRKKPRDYRKKPRDYRASLHSR